MSEASAASSLERMLDQSIEDDGASSMQPAPMVAETPTATSTMPACITCFKQVGGVSRGSGCECCGAFSALVANAPVENRPERGSAAWLRMANVAADLTARGLSPSFRQVAERVLASSGAAQLRQVQSSPQSSAQSVSASPGGAFMTPPSKIRRKGSASVLALAKAESRPSPATPRTPADMDGSRSRLASPSAPTGRTSQSADHGDESDSEEFESHWDEELAIVRESIGCEPPSMATPTI